jgi:hypothetical protein
MGKTFEALDRAEEQRRLQFKELFTGDNGSGRRKFTPLLSHEANSIFPPALKQNGSIPGPPLTKGGWGDFWANIPFWFRRGRARIYEQKLNQMEQTVDELNKMLSGLITSMKKTIEERESCDGI